MDPNNANQDQADETPATEPSMQAPSNGTDIPAPVSPLQAITESEKEPEASVPTDLSSTPEVAPQVMAAPVEKKKSKTTLYLLIALGVLVLAAAGLFVYTLL